MNYATDSKDLVFILYKLVPCSMKERSSAQKKVLLFYIARFNHLSLLQGFVVALQNTVQINNLKIYKQTLDII